MRRSSPVSQFAVSAALEALGPVSGFGTQGRDRLGIVCAVMGGGVTYSRRFFAEVLANPATASPMLFPETVFNAPAAHLAAVLGATGPNVTLVGDQTGFLCGLAVAAGWLADGQVDGCLVVGAEEGDWLTARAWDLFRPTVPAAEGAAAVLLRREPSGVELRAVTEPVLYRRFRTRCDAAEAAERNLPGRTETTLWVDSADWEPPVRRKTSGPTVVPREVLGEGFGAAGGWACVSAVHAVQTGRTPQANVRVAGSNLQAMAAVLGSPTTPFP
jgi:3-oxoacyl-(acyl-carrier-protein) synthase